MIQLLNNLDIEAFILLNSVVGDIALIDNLIVIFGSYLTYVLPLVAVVLLFRAHRSMQEKLSIGGTVLVAALIARYGLTPFIRFFYHRPRPFLTYDVHQLLYENSYSFPSGHATFFFALSTAMYMHNKKWGAGFFIATILMTIARVMAGVHYPFDIIGGMLIGVTVGYISVRYLKPLLSIVLSRSSTAGGINLMRSFKVYIDERPTIRIIVGGALLAIGLASIITPLTPGSWLAVVGLELLGIRIVFFDKFRFWKKDR